MIFSNKKIVVLCALYSTLYFFLFYFGTINKDELYYKYFRQYFFTSFLGMGSFIFALMTAILFTMKDKLYASDEYIAIQIEVNKDKPQVSSIFLPLIDIGNLFITTVILCIATSVTQITIRLNNSNIAAAIGMATASTTLTITLFVICKVRRTMLSWFNILNNQILPNEYTSKSRKEEKD